MRMPSLFKENTDRVAGLLRDADLAAAVLLSPSNFTYTTGATLSAQRDIPERLSIVVIDADARTRVVLCNIDEPSFRRDSWIHGVHTYVEGETSPMEVTAVALAAMGLGRGRFGIERRAMSVETFAEAQQRMRQATFVPFDAALNALRATKSAAELRVITRGCALTEQALYEAVGQFRLGQTEAQLARHVHEALERRGAHAHLLNVVSGDLTEVPNAVARPKVIDEGAMVKVDVSGSFDGYLSDMARVFFAGKADAVQLQRYATYVGVYREILDGVRPGVTGGQVFAHAVDVHARHGMTFAVPHVGHGIGIALHDDPLLRSANADVLGDGMALAIEPRFVVAPSERIHLEDIVVLANGGAVVHADLARLEEPPIIG